jgi:hypothetical protein
MNKTYDNHGLGYYQCFCDKYSYQIKQNDDLYKLCLRYDEAIFGA